MNHRDLVPLIGREGVLRCAHDFACAITITAADVTYGRPRLLVTGLGPHGEPREAWVSAVRVYVPVGALSAVPALQACTMLNGTIG